jgi:fibronectin-binding autotransporter adhesin
VNATVVSALPTVARSAVTMDDAGSGGSLLAMTASQQVASLASPVSSSSINLNGNNLTVGAASGTTHFAGVISGSGGSLTKDSASTQVLSGNNTYTGLTTVDAGELVVSGSLTGTVNVAAASSAILSSGNNVSSQVGALTVASDATVGGTVAPGASGDVAGLTTIGQLNTTGDVVLGSLAQAGLAHLAIEIGGTNDGAGGGNGFAALQYDRVGTTGAVTLNSVNLDLSKVNSFEFSLPTFDGGTQQYLTDGHIFFLITGATSITGRFANDSNGVAASTFDNFSTITGAGGQVFAISYSASFSSDQFSVGGGTDVAIMAIPEPNSLAMLAGSLGIALGLQRFRRRRHG